MRYGLANGKLTEAELTQAVAIDRLANAVISSLSLARPAHDAAIQQYFFAGETPRGTPAERDQFELLQHLRSPELPRVVRGTEFEELWPLWEYLSHDVVPGTTPAAAYAAAQPEAANEE